MSGIICCFFSMQKSKKSKDTKASKSLDSTGTVTHTVCVRNHINVSDQCVELLVQMFSKAVVDPEMKRYHLLTFIIPSPYPLICFHMKQRQIKFESVSCKSVNTCHCPLIIISASPELSNLFLQHVTINHVTMIQCHRL